VPGRQVVQLDPAISAKTGLPLSASARPCSGVNSVAITEVNTGQSRS
jgi:hypothetical protein